jgi:hypothetical protein
MLRFHPRVAWQDLQGEVMVVDLDRSAAGGFNSVGSFIWSRLEKESPEAIVSRLTGTFDVEPDVARRDVDAFIGYLKNRGWIEEFPA